MKKKIICLLLCLSCSVYGCGLKDTNLHHAQQEKSIENVSANSQTQSLYENDEEQQNQDNPLDAVDENRPAEITLAFTGDIYFPDNLYEYYLQDGIQGFLSQNIIDTMQNADLYIADHEFVASDGGKMVDYQLYTFRAPLEREKLWVEMGTDVITLANNHTLDYGISALQDTMHQLDELKISYVGAGNNLKDALTPCIKEVNGKKIAIFGSTRFVPQGSWYATESNPGLLTSYESTPYYGYILDAIREAKKECDYVIIYVHFGVEKSHSVALFQKNIAHGYVDAGADIVVGTHPHVLEGIEFYNGKPIVYSLGNFLFGNYHSDTVVLNATIQEDNTTQINLLPCSSQSYQTTDLTGEDARKLFDFMESISFDIKIDDEGNVTPVK
ncbi:MAG: CapA family protein [Lachnospiraceae bacterium]|nr:CapA family protein [Lachnospiraceae bacterium]